MESMPFTDVLLPETLQLKLLRFLDAAIETVASRRKSREAESPKALASWSLRYHTSRLAS